MKVENNFPKSDRVLYKLKQFSKFFEEKQKQQISEEEMDDCESAMNAVDNYIDAIERYLDSVCNAEDRISQARKEAEKKGDNEELIYVIKREDDRRTVNHSSIILSMTMIDRLAKKYNIEKVFDYAEEFEHESGKIAVMSGEEKAKLTSRERTKRRELGNFGLYIAASVTAGMSKEHMIDDDEAREFANTETGENKSDPEIRRKVKESSINLKRNMERIIE